MTQRADIFTDEAFVEFDLSELKPGCDATLEMVVLSPPHDGTLVARKFEISTYIGSGVPDFSHFGTGNYLATFTVDAPPSQYQDAMLAFSLDIATQVSDAIANGHQFLGVRLHDPSDVTFNDPLVRYAAGSATILFSVPEPSALVLIIVAAVSSLAYIRRWRKQAA